MHKAGVFIRKKFYPINHFCMKASFKTITTVIAVAALFLTSNLKAQINPAGEWRFSIGPEVGFPTGIARLGANFNLGGFEICLMFYLLNVKMTMM